MRTNFDFTPYRRSTVGFDRLFNLLEAGAREDDGYPLFDIVKLGDDSFRITLAIAGFRPDDIEIVAQQNQLTVTGKRADDADKGEYLHRGDRKSGVVVKSVSVRVELGGRRIIKKKKKTKKID